MKKLIIYSLIALLAASTLSLSSCKDKDDEDPTTAKSQIHLVPFDGANVDVNGMDVELHRTAKYDDLYKSFTSSGSATSANAELEEIDPGTYFLVAWKDIDGNTFFSSGDYFGFYPGALTFEAGDEQSHTIEVYVID